MTHLPLFRRPGTWVRLALVFTWAAPLAASGAPVPPPAASLSADAAASGVLAAELLLLRGESGAAITRYLELAQPAQDRELAGRAAQLASALELPALTLQAAELWARLSPKDEDARRLLEEAQLHAGDWPRLAREASQRIRETEPARRGEAIDAAMLRWAEAEDAVAAAQVAAKVAADWPTFPEAWSGLAQVAANAALTTRAQAALRKLAALRSLTAEEEFLRVRLLAAAGDRDAVLKALGEPRADEPPGPRLLRAQVLLGDADEARVRQAVDALLQSPRLRGIGLRFQAARELRAGRYDEAERLFSELDTLNPKDGEGALGLANVARARGNADLALDRYSRIQQGPQALTAQAALWRLRRERGQPLEAAAAFDRFLAENIDLRADGVALRASLLLRAGEPVAALALAESALRGLPGHEGLLQVWASALDQVGRRRESLAWYAARTRARPWDPEALNNHAYQLALAGEQLPLALKLAQQAVAERPNAAYLDTLGWVQFRRGQLKPAREALEAALQRGPEPEISAHLGEVLWALGEQAAALAKWREGLKGAAAEDAVTLRTTARRVAGQEL